VYDVDLPRNQRFQDQTQFRERCRMYVDRRKLDELSRLTWLEVEKNLTEEVVSIEHLKRRELLEIDVMT
jgi:hypothetical protein